MNWYYVVNNDGQAGLIAATIVLAVLHGFGGCGMLT